MGIGNDIFTPVNEELHAPEKMIDIYAQNSMNCLHKSIEIIRQAITDKAIQSKWKDIIPGILQPGETIDFDVKQLFQRLLNLELEHWKLWIQAGDNE